MFSFLGFWVTSINGFIFTFVTKSPMLQEVVVITRLSVDGDKLFTFFTLLIEELGIQFSKSRALYSAFLIANAKSKGIIFYVEHHAFVLY